MCFLKVSVDEGFGFCRMKKNNLTYKVEFVSKFTDINNILPSCYNPLDILTTCYIIA